MKHRIIFCLACLLMLMSQSSWAEQKPRVRLASIINYDAGGETVTLQGGIIYYLDKSERLDISNNQHNPVNIDATSDKPAIIFLDEASTLTVISRAMGKAGIHLLDNKGLIIVGETNSRIYVEGGYGERGGAGSNGGSGDLNPGSNKHNKGGGGGNGGYGGTGGAPGIGGNATGRANGGQAGSGADSQHNWPASPNDNGGPGDACRLGESMGTLYLLGNLDIQSRKGDCDTRIGPQAQAGSNSRKAHCWAKAAVSGGGGGGHGGNGGAAKYDIGGAGNSGGGGGGGGGGAVDGDNYFGRWSSDYLKDAVGQGGFAGYDGDGQLRNLQGAVTDHQSFSYQAPSGETHHAEAGRGGLGGGLDPKHPAADNGTIFVAPSITLYASIKEKNTLAPDNYPYKTFVKFIRNNVQTMRFPSDYAFLYGTEMAASLGETTPTSANKNQTFEGFYLNGNPVQLVYDKNGNLNREYRDLLHTFDDVILVARWSGRADMTRELLLQNVDDDNYVCAASVHSHLKLTKFPDTVEAKAFTPDEKVVPEGFHFSPSDIATKTFTVNAGGLVYATFKYDRNVHNVTFINSDPANVNIYADNDTIHPVNSFVRSARYGKFITEPKVKFNSFDDAMGYERIWTGPQMNKVLGDADATETLSLRAKKFAVYALKVEGGSVKDCSLFKPDSVTYKTSHSWTIVPENGYQLVSVKAYKYSDTLDSIYYESEVHINDAGNGSLLWTMESMPSSDIIIVPTFKKIKYNVHVSYVDEEGRPVHGMESTFKADSSNPIDAVTIAPDGFTYNANQTVLMYAQKTENPNDYFVEPTVTVAPDKKVDVTPCYLNLNKMDVHHLAFGDSIVVGYCYEAPASDTNVQFTVTERKKGTCHFFNEIEGCTMDSSFVNMKKQADELKYQQSGSGQFRAFDIVGFVSSETDTSIIKAGYWDDKNEYHRLDVYNMRLSAESGRYTNFYYTIAPEAQNMIMGFVGDRVCISENRNNQDILAVYDGKRVNVSLVRKYRMNPNLYNSICLPFSLSREQIDDIFGNETVIAEYTSSQMVNDKLCHLNFRAASSLKAGVPYLINPTKEITDTINVNNVLIDSRAKEVKQEHATFIGRFDKTEFKGGDKTVLFPTVNRLCFPSVNCKPMRALRGYFKLADGLTCEKINFVIVAEGSNGDTVTYPSENESADFETEEPDGLTAIQEVKAETPSGGIRKVLYQGSLYIIVNGQMYDAIGNRIK